jgi:hypothetical protein
MSAITTQRLSLKPSDLLTHYALPFYLLIPTAVAVYCIVTNHYVPSAIPAMAVLCSVTLAASGIFAWYQTRALRFRVFHTSSDAHENYEKVLQVLHKERWQIQYVQPDSRIVATARGFPLSWGERVEVRFDGTNVLVNSICDPAKSLSCILGQKPRTCELHSSCCHKHLTRRCSRRLPAVRPLCYD